MRFNALVREKKGKWKELYDSDKQRRFFYNKLTGEIRSTLTLDPKLAATPILTPTLTPT